MGGEKIYIHTSHKDEVKTQAIYFSHRRRPVEAYVTLKGRHVPFVNNVKHHSVILYKSYTENTYKNDRCHGPSNMH
jgi:hypothetical protein